MHTIGVCHRDIKLDNMIFEDENHNHIRLIDFGLATYFGWEKMKEFIGTPYYVCPEILEKKFYDEKCDIWSLGVSLARALSGNYPF